MKKRLKFLFRLLMTLQVIALPMALYWHIETLNVRVLGLFYLDGILLALTFTGYKIIQEKYNKKE